MYVCGSGWARGREGACKSITGGEEGLNEHNHKDEAGEGGTSVSMI